MSKSEYKLQVSHSRDMGKTFTNQDCWYVTIRNETTVVSGPFPNKFQAEKSKRELNDIFDKSTNTPLGQELCSGVFLVDRTVKSSKGW